MKKAVFALAVLALSTSAFATEPKKPKCDANYVCPPARIATDDIAGPDEWPEWAAPADEEIASTGTVSE